MKSPLLRSGRLSYRHFDVLRLRRFHCSVRPDAPSPGCYGWVGPWRPMLEE